MSAAQVDPHDKMRARDVNKVARGEQAPRPPHEYGTVSPPPPPTSTNIVNKKQEEEEKEKLTDSSSDYKMRHCYVTYVEYQRCIKKKGEMAAECEKIGKHCRSFCPKEWMAEWDKEREEGRFPEQI